MSAVPLVLHSLLFATPAVLVVALIAWRIGVRFHKHDVVDTMWGLGFIVAAYASAFATSGHGDSTRRILLLTFVTIWGLRLSIYLAVRNHGLPQDPRYTAMLSSGGSSPDWYALRIIYLLQSLSLLFIGLPINFGLVANAKVGVIGGIGVMLFLLGFSFESIGDAQMRIFKSRPENKGKVMDRGLWRFTRHPNYFGDFTLWWGLFLIAAEHGPGILTLPAPLFMSWLLIKKTGKPMLEKQLQQTRPGYREYIDKTSGFFPRLPKR
jgi:steroid 5-alpha reductase family enzyme